MNEWNPYQAPASFSEEAQGEFSVEKCPSCENPLTFWAALKLPTPFRFRCAQCRAVYDVRTPLMGLIFAGIIAGSVIGVVATLWTVFRFGFFLLLVIVPFASAAYLALEWWTYRYILRYGRLRATMERGS